MKRESIRQLILVQNTSTLTSILVGSVNMLAATCVFIEAKVVGNLHKEKHSSLY